ncbi:MAG: cytochrome b/b6 domain-containing protein [Rubrivivax sp.]|nr:cytochrome b/b6 domain-containing protein [Rubrivivax sp.]
MPDPHLQPVRVWDLPTRLFHWVLAITVAGSVFSAKIGGNAMVWHFRFGYVVFTLLGFRLLWGLIGGHWSRFASFLYSPRTVFRYLRGELRPGENLDVGHNPLGSLSVLALLSVLAVQVGTGLVADDEIANLGPLNRFVSSATGLAATGWHKQWGQWMILGLVVLHVAAIFFYLLRRKTNLVRPMVSGDKPVPPGTPASADGLPQRLLALGVLVACTGLVSWVVSLGS